MQVPRGKVDQKSHFCVRPQCRDGTKLRISASVHSAETGPLLVHFSARNLQVPTSSKEGNRKCSRKCEMVTILTLRPGYFLRTAGGGTIIKISTIHSITLLLFTCYKKKTIGTQPEISTPRTLFSAKYIEGSTFFHQIPGVKNATFL